MCAKFIKKKKKEYTKLLWVYTMIQTCCITNELSETLHGKTISSEISKTMIRHINQ